MVLIGHVFARGIHLAVQHFHIEREQRHGRRHRLLQTSRGQDRRMPAFDLSDHRREQPVEFERAHGPQDLLRSRVERTVHLRLRRIAVDSRVPLFERTPEDPKIVLEQAGVDFRRRPRLGREEPG